MPDTPVPDDSQPTLPETPLALSAIHIRVAPIASGMRGIDCLAPLTAEEALSFRQAGYEYVCRYLDNLTLAEVSGILAAGLGLVGIRECRAPGWEPTGAMGASDGARTVALAHALGLPQGMAIACDLEGCLATTGHDEATAYLTNWAAAVTASGYVAMLYVGFACVLSGVELSALPHFTHYWRSCSAVPELPVGYCMLQLRPGNVSRLGHLVDVCVVEHDWHSPARTPPAMWSAS